MSNKKVSIITTSFNSAKTIEDTIKSVIGQTYPNIEYIIIDGGSTDGTQEIVKKYGTKIAKFVSEKDRGIYDGMNKGFRIATGDIIGQINSDDFYASSDVIEAVVNKMGEADSRACWGDLQYVDDKDVNKIVRDWKSSEYAEGKFINGWMPPHPTFFVRKEIYEKYGMFRLDMGTAADYELMLRLLEKHKIRSCYVPKIMVKMRQGGASNKSIQARFKANQKDYKAWKVNGLKISRLRLLLKPLSKLSQYFSNESR